MRVIRFLLSVVLVSFSLISCSQTLPPTPPSSVTNAKALETYRNAVGGDTAALLKIGVHYVNGTEGFPEDKRMAANAFETAAKLGNVSAQMLIGSCYENGEGRLQSDSQALEYYRRAQASGYGSAAKHIKRVEDRIRAEEAARRTRVRDTWNKAAAQSNIYMGDTFYISPIN